MHLSATKHLNITIQPSSDTYPEMYKTYYRKTNFSHGSQIHTPDGYYYFFQNYR